MSIFFNNKYLKPTLYSLFKNFLQHLNSISNIYFLNIIVISRWFYLQHLSQSNFKWMFGNIFSKTVYFPQIFWLNFCGECFQALPGDDFRHSSRLKNFFQNIVFNTGFPNLRSLMIKILTLIRWKSSFSSFVQKKAGGRGREREPAGVFKRVFKKVFQKRAPAWVFKWKRSFASSQNSFHSGIF